MSVVVENLRCKFWWLWQRWLWAWQLWY